MRPNTWVTALSREETQSALEAETAGDAAFDALAGLDALTFEVDQVYDEAIASLKPPKRKWLKAKR